MPKGVNHHLSEFDEARCREIVAEYWDSDEDMNAMSLRMAMSPRLLKEILNKGGMTQEQIVLRGRMKGRAKMVDATRGGRGCVERDRSILAVVAEMPNAAMSRIADEVKRRSGHYVCRRTVQHCLDRLAKGRVDAKALPKCKPGDPAAVDFWLKFQATESPYFVAAARARGSETLVGRQVED